MGSPLAPSTYIAVRRVTSFFTILSKIKKIPIKKKKLKNTNLWLKPCLDVINPDHKEYLCIFRHIFMAKSGDWKTFFNLFSAKMSLFKNLFFLSNSPGGLLFDTDSIIISQVCFIQGSISYEWCTMMTGYLLCSGGDVSDKFKIIC